MGSASADGECHGIGALGARRDGRPVARTKMRASLAHPPTVTRSNTPTPGTMRNRLAQIGTLGHQLAAGDRVIAATARQHRSVLLYPPDSEDLTRRQERRRSNGAENSRYFGGHSPKWSGYKREDN